MYVLMRTKMQTYRIWEGTTWLPDSKYRRVIEVVGEELGMLEDVDLSGEIGRTFFVYKASVGDIIIHLVWKTNELGGRYYGEVHRFCNLEEASQSEFRRVLEELNLI
jgi:hypothetical protein